ncbi:MAG: hypothetical protein K8W52_30825 [Deltaproteobacteria bacterium]|nr:hypothetical protein [Deltaproteobacteria bacterium]
MQFAAEIPPGWTRSPFPAPQRGLYLRPPAGGPRGALLLMDALTPTGTLAEQLAAAVKTGCAGTVVLAEHVATPFATVAFPGLSVATRVRVTHAGREHEELRIFALIDAGAMRLPIVYLGEVGSAEVYQQAIGLVLSTVRPTGTPLPR